MRKITLSLVLLIYILMIVPVFSEEYQDLEDYKYYVEMSESTLQEYIDINSDIYKKLLSDSLNLKELNQDQVDKYKKQVDRLIDVANECIGWTMDRITVSATIAYGGIDNAVENDQWVLLMTACEETYTTQIDKLSLAKEGLTSSINDALEDKRINSNEAVAIMTNLHEIDMVLALTSD